MPPPATGNDCRPSISTALSATTPSLIEAGETIVFRVDNLPAVTYTFFCDQPGHETPGIKGTLTAS